MAHVIVVAGAHRGLVHTVKAPMCVVARRTSGNHDLSLPRDDYVSRCNDASGRGGHAMLESREGAWFVKDLGSANKTWVVLKWNWQELAHGANVRMAPVFLFGCGLSSLLFLASDAKPTDLLVKELCRGNIIERGTPVEQPSTTVIGMETETNPAPRSEQDRAMSLWNHIVKTMRTHGYEGEL